MKGSRLIFLFSVAVFICVVLTFFLMYPFGLGFASHNIKIWYEILEGFPGGSVVKNLLVKAGDPGSILGSGRSPEEGNGTLLQYSCLENPMDRGAWWATVHRVAKSQTQLSN